MAVIRRANNQKMNPQGWGGLKLPNLGSLLASIPKQAINMAMTAVGPGTLEQKTPKLIKSASEIVQPYIPQIQNVLGVNKPPSQGPVIPHLQKLFGVTK